MARLQSIADPWWLTLVLLMALSFNNWLLAPWLSPALFKAHAEVSELSVITQPHAVVFRLLDIASGILFIVCGVAFYKYAKRRGRLIKAVSISLVIFGACNVFDATFPLPCSQTLDKICNLGVSTSLHSFHIPTHGISSVIIGTYYLIFPLFGVLYYWRYKVRQPWLITISAVAIIMALTAAGKVLTSAITTDTVPTAGGGVYQEIQMSFFGLWFIVACLALRRPG